MAQRVPIAETNFFSIVIAIQGKSGGNLSEALGNLSRVLRERKKMKGKISAMSMEAKASAAIIGAVPFLVVGALYVSSPKYVSLLVDDDAWPDDLRDRDLLDGDRHRDDEEDDHLRLLTGACADAGRHSRQVLRRAFPGGPVRGDRLGRDGAHRRDALAPARHAVAPHQGGEHRARAHPGARARAAAGGAKRSRRCG